VLPRLYAIVDTDACAARGLDPVALAGIFLDAGVRLLQLRAKALPSGALLSLAAAIAAEARRAGALFVVNDRADLAALAGASGVHVGQDDLAPADARLVTGPGTLVGLSTHTPAQIAAAVAAPIDYLAVGPVYGTGSKDTGYTAVGLDLVRHAATAAAAHRLPVVAIGGITLDTAPQVVAAGASSVAIISDLLATGDPSARARAYVERLGRV
jgi:thiamine-phosphate pyrophosphorylase